jgi:hypothetical protein
MPKKATTSPNDDKHQVAEFRKAARELGCEDSEERFQGTLLKLGKPKPKEPGSKRA